MSSTTTNRNQLEAPPSAHLLDWSTRAASGLALLSFLLVLGQIVTRTSVLGSGRAEALLIIATTISTLLTLAKQLPGNQVLIGGIIVAVSGSALHAVGAATSIPFGPFAYAEVMDPCWFGRTLAWPMPMLWLIVVFNARGVARLGLKPWRKTKTYGFWVIGVAAVLVVLFTLSLEVFATKVARGWFWLPTKFAFTWHGMPWTNLLGWALGTLVMLAFATPFLITKNSRSRRLPPDYHPLIVWILLLVLCGTGAAMEGLWSAAILATVTAVGSAGFAIRGARW